MSPIGALWEGSVMVLKAMHLLKKKPDPAVPVNPSACARINIYTLLNFCVYFISVIYICVCDDRW